MQVVKMVVAVLVAALVMGGVPSVKAEEEVLTAAYKYMLTLKEEGRTQKYFFNAGSFCISPDGDPYFPITLNHRRLCRAEFPIGGKLTLVEMKDGLFFRCSEKYGCQKEGTPFDTAYVEIPPFVISSNSGYLGSVEVTDQEKVLYPFSVPVGKRRGTEGRQ